MKLKDLLREVTPTRMAGPGEADITAMPIEYAPEYVKKFNETICADLGITAPDGYEAIEG